MGDFHGTRVQIWAGLGPIGSTEEKGLGRLWATFEGGFFVFSRAKKMLNFYKNIEVYALRSCIK